MTQYHQPPYQPDIGYANLPPQDQEGLGSWVLVTFLMLIPVVNFIYLLVLAFGSGQSRAKQNFARASLIWWAVGIVLSIITFILIAAFGFSFFNELANTTYGGLDS